jgi:hypothetical protein
VSIDSVAVLPWLTLKEPVKVGEVTFYPAELADDVLGDRAAILKDRLRIYRDTWDSKPVHASFAVHHRQLEHGEHAPVKEIREATNIFLTAAIFQNDGGLGHEVNATTFALFFQGLGGEVGFMAMRVRRRYGGFVTGSTTDKQVVRPAYAASLTDYSRELIDALVAAQSHPEARQLFTALDWFRRASTEADNIDHEVDLVLLLTATDFLLAHAGSRRHGGLDQERIVALLSRFDLRPCCSVRRTKVERSHIQTFLFVLDRVRNETLHPDADEEQTEHYSFGRSNVAFAWFADRCFMALLVARLIDLGMLQETENLRAFVAGVEEWLFEPKDSLGKIMLDVKLKHAVRNYVSVLRDREIKELGVATEIDDLRKQWQQDFFTALNPVPDPFRVELQWLADGSVRVTILRGTSRESEFLDDMLADPETDEPTRIAWAAKSYFSRNSIRQAPGDITDADLRAMRNPRVFLGGTMSN